MKPQDGVSAGPPPPGRPVSGAQTMQASQDQGIPASAWLLLLVLALAWGSTWPMMKLAVAEIPVLSFRFISVVAGSMTLFMVGWIKNRNILPKRWEWSAIIRIGLLNVALWYSLSALAVTTLPAGRAALLAFTTPLWAMIIEMLLYKAPVTVRRAFGIVLALAAIGFLTFEDLFAVEPSFIGIAAILAASFCQTFGSILQQRAGFESPVYTLIPWQMVLGGIPILIAAPIIDGTEWMGTVSLEAVLASFSVAVFSICVGVVSWYTILSKTTMTFAALGSLVVPFAAISLSAVLLGETLTATDIIGLVLITAAIGTTIRRRRAA
ncbi:DMT family transporter [Hwanghaeella grinnelliae]|uniref:DMT family transporter n=1 Tax=Hwanghaeella grinnelliae TaxID=2500179 RepID=A0A3S2VS29_9PROT|nr:DMT family transporter [Hwanghaeella grinnelliae]RVU39195.1 DMT family transporter [Hwanghaeella grinnelliae]